MSNKATNKDYLLRQLHNFNDIVLENKYPELVDIAPAFSTSTNYAVGDYVSYEGSIYKCTTAHSAGAWVSGDFTAVVITNELGGGGGTAGVSSFNGRTGAVVPTSGDYTKSDVGLGNVANTGDSATPVSGGTTKFTTGGAYTELNKKADKVTGTFTSGDFASLDANGNIVDSGHKHGDYLTSHQSVTLSRIGTASETITSYQKLQIDGTATGAVVSGSMYLVDSTPDTTTESGYSIFTFTNSNITSSAAYEIYADVFGVSPTSFTISSTTATIKFKSSDNVTSCRLYIK